jgi:hypothetical protein
LRTGIVVLGTFRSSQNQGLTARQVKVMVDRSSWPDQGESRDKTELSPRAHARGKLRPVSFLDALVPDALVP